MRTACGVSAKDESIDSVAARRVCQPKKDGWIASDVMCVCVWWEGGGEEVNQTDETDGSTDNRVG